MTGPCPLSALGFVSGTLATIDCHAQNLAEESFSTMGMTGPFGPVLSGFLTIAVALIGYRMLMGEVPTLRAGMVTFAKIGIVLTLLSSWPAFSTLIAHVALAGPADIAQAVGPPAGLPAAASGLAERLDDVANRLEQVSTALATASSPPPTPSKQSGAPRALAPAASSPSAPSPPSVVETPGASMLRQTRIVFLVGAVAGLAAVHLIAGLLSAVAPLLTAFLLFDATRGFVEGGLRVLGSGLLAGAGIALTLALELALVSPRVGELVQLVEASEPIDTAAIELLALVILFAILQVAIGAASPIVIARLRLPRSLTAPRVKNPQSITDPVTPPLPAHAAVSRIPAPPSRAQSIADSVASLRRREVTADRPAALSGDTLRSSLATPSMPPSVDIGTSLAHVGGSRSAGRRTSASAERRDRRG